MKDETRFWSKVTKTDGCWLWKGGTARGYGTIQVDGSMRLAHRVSYEMANGPIPRGLLVCHRCDQPLCVRPDHLFLGSHAENLADAIAKRRHRTPPRKLTDEQCREAQQLRRQGETLQRIADRFGVSLSTIHAYLKRPEPQEPGS